MGNSKKESYRNKIQYTYNSENMFGAYQELYTKLDKELANFDIIKIKKKRYSPWLGGKAIYELSNTEASGILRIKIAACGDSKNTIPVVVDIQVSHLTKENKDLVDKICESMGN